jgi:HK97 family phage portal protein
MRLPDLLFRSRRPATEDRALTWLPWWDRGMDGPPSNTFSGATVDNNSALTLSAVYAAATLIADAVASLPAEALSGDERVELPQWIRSPNRDLRRFDFWNQMMLAVLLTGNAYAQFILRPSDAVPIGLDIIEPHRVHVEWNPRVPGERRYKVDNGEWLSRREMFHIQGPTMPGQVKGMSVVTVARESIALGLTLEEFGARYFGQGSQAKVVIEMPQTANVDFKKAREIVKVFELFHKGRGNWHRPAVMSGGAKLHNIQISPEDSQFLQSREFQLIEIARWFRVPPHRIGIISKSSSWGSGLAEENTAMVQHTFKPWILRVEEALSAYAPGPEGLGMKIRLVDSGLLRGTAKEQADLYIALYESKLITRDEGRVPLGFAPVGGEDGGFLTDPVPAATPPIGKSEPSEAGQPGSRTPDKRSDVDEEERARKAGKGGGGKQPRDKLGQFASTNSGGAAKSKHAPSGTPGSAPGTVTTRSRLSDLDDKGRAAVADSMKQWGITEASLDADIASRITPESLEEGRNWYREAKQFNSDLAKKSGLTVEQTTAITSAVSPRMPWPRNKVIAERIAMQSRNFGSDVDDLTAAKRIGGALSANMKPAVAIARGKSIEDTLSGVKRRSFYYNMLRPGETDDVTVDVWMMRGARQASSKQMSDEDALKFVNARKGATGVGAGYIAISESVRRVAADKGLSTEEVQAAYWVHIAGSKDGLWGRNDK